MTIPTRETSNGIDWSATNGDGKESCPPIAIVGIACRLPGGASSPEKLWEILENAKSTQGKVPRNRFNVDGIYDPDPDWPGTTHADGGYFIEDDIWGFENLFFGINNREAETMDPQQRKLLEIVFECFENAGVTLEEASGANIGCFVANFLADFSFNQVKDPQYFTRYSGTGMGTSILANRISYVFNLQGPSLTIDTACSSSFYSLNTACNALLANECDSAIVAGVNLIQSSESHIAVSKLGVLSKSSTCHTFDASADGYARGDGVNALYIKRLDDAIRDCDRIRSVIRGTAVNSNGRTNGITLPDGLQQQKVIRKAYTKAGLDLDQTDYVECHGTGTAVGDPVEVEAIANTLGRRKNGQPLLLGSIKTNIGHGEAASGISSLIKATLILEKGLIPPSINLKTLNPKIKADEWNVEVVRETQPFPERNLPGRRKTRRISVNSFGYGGANAHVILEDAESHLRSRFINGHVKQQPEGERMFLLPFSTSNPSSLKSRVDAICQKTTTLDDLPRLAYTLCLKRSFMKSRGYVIVRGNSAQSDLQSSALIRPSLITGTQALPLVFVFTGQGAQWPRMGIELLTAYPGFRQTIEKLDLFLKCLEQPPAWTIQEVLSEEAEVSNINTVLCAQTITTAIQVALVELLWSWSITPLAVIGHSSGEIAAAFAAGHIDAQQALAMAYYRGLVVFELDKDGAMMAAGVGEDEANSLIDKAMLSKSVRVACINSPESITFSGDKEAIQTLYDTLIPVGKFARILKTGGKAYHSHHMPIVSKKYKSLLTEVFAAPRPETSKLSEMMSTVSSQAVEAQETANASYWCSNLESPVLFSSGILALCSKLGPCHFIELGPHSALQLPIKQTISESLPFGYDSTLKRNSDAVQSVLSMIGNLYNVGHNPPLSEVNNLNPHMAKEYIWQDRVLNEMPPYPWDYSATQVHEPLAQIAYKQKRHPRHELLGEFVADGNGRTYMWRNLLNAHTSPWISDHKLDEVTVMPTTAYMLMAYEGVSQILDAPVDSAFELRDIYVPITLSIPESGFIEIFTEIKRDQLSNKLQSDRWWQFSITTKSKNVSLEHSRGYIRIQERENESQAKIYDPDTSGLQSAHHRTWYERFRKVGLGFGPRFQSLSEIHIPRNRTWRKVLTKLDIPRPTRGSDWRLKVQEATVTLDAMMQTALISFSRGIASEMRGLVPVFIGKGAISPLGDLLVGNKVHATSKPIGVGSFSFRSTLTDPSHKIKADFSDAKMLPLPYRMHQEDLGSRNPYWRILWKPDITMCEQLRIKNGYLNTADGFGSPSSRTQELLYAVDLLAHKDPSLDILCLDLTKELVMEILSILRIGTTFQRLESFTVGTINQGKLTGKAIMAPGDLDTDDTKATALTDKVYNLIILPSIDQELLSHSLVPQDLTAQLSPFGKILVKEPWKEVSSLHQKLSLSPQNIKGLNECFILERDSDAANVQNFDPKNLLLVTDDSPCELDSFLNQAWVAEFNTQVNMVSLKELTSESLSAGTNVISTVEVQDPVLQDSSDEEFEQLKLLLSKPINLLWVTGGSILTGDKPEHSLFFGLHRVIGMEIPSTKISTIDVQDWMSDIYLATNSILRVFKGKFNPYIDDREYILHHRQLFVSRLVPDESMNQNFRDRTAGLVSSNQLSDSGKCNLSIKTLGQFDTIHFTKVDTETAELRQDFVEVKVSCVSLNAKSVYTFAGTVDTEHATCSFECSGTITRVGSDIEHLKTGDRVVAMYPGHFGTYEQVPASCCIKLQEWEDFATMSTIPVVFATAIYALQDRANLQAGETVLIHSATGGLGIVAIQLAKSMGAKIFATVGTPSKKKYLMDNHGIPEEQIFSSRDSSFLPEIMEATKGEGVDVVLNSLTGDLLHDSWCCCSQFGRFVELGEKDIKESGLLKMRQFKNGTTFTAFDLATLIYSKSPTQKRKMASLMERTINYYRQGTLKAVQPMKVFDVSEISRAFHYFSQRDRMGKVVVSFNDPASKIPFIQPKWETRFDPQKSYLLVGCLGGLGRSLSRWMAGRGARKFVFLQPSGSDKPAAKQIIADLESVGADVIAIKGSVTNYEDVEKAIRSAKTPFGGVIQGAMRLKEKIFSIMPNEDWHQGIDPKVIGTWNLHRAFDHIPLDFFVLCSSNAGALGTATQGNYCASNAFLDTFSRYRRSRNLPCVSLGIGVVSEVGYLHEHPEIEAMMLRKGVRPILEEEMLQIFDNALSGHMESAISDHGHFANGHILTGLETSVLQEMHRKGFEGDWQILSDPRASLLATSVKRATSEKGRGRESEALGLIGSGSTATIPQMENLLAKKLSNLVLLPVDKLDHSAGLASFGMDSMLATDLRSYIFQQTKVEVAFLMLMSGSMSIKSLAELIVNGQ